MSKQFEYNSPLGDKFDGFEVEPSNSSWESIHAALDSNDNTAPLSEKFKNDLEPVSVDVWTNIEEELHPKKKRRFIYWWSGIAAGLIGIAVFMNLSDTENKMMTSNEIVPQEKLILKDIKSSNLIIKEGVLLSGRELKDTNYKNKIESNQFDDLGTSSQDLIIKDEAFSLDTVNDNFYILSLDKRNDVKLDLENEGIKKIKTINRSNLLLDNKNGKEVALKSLKFGVSPLLGLSKSQEEPLIAFNSISNPQEFVDVNNSGNVVSNSTDPDLIFVANTFTPVSSLSFTPNSQVVYNNSKQYNQPISFGALFSYSIKTRLAISSGLEYTSTSYSFDEGYWKAFQRTGVKSYLGIPITINYNVLNNERYQFYPIIGMKVYRGIYGKDTYVYENSANDVGLEKVSVSNTKFGISGSLGIGTQMKLYKKLQFYLQASSEYAVKAPEDSYWNDNPLSLSFQAGFSIKL